MRAAIPSVRWTDPKQTIADRAHDRQVRVRQERVVGGAGYGSVLEQRRHLGHRQQGDEPGAGRRDGRDAVPGQLLQHGPGAVRAPRAQREQRGGGAEGPFALDQRGRAGHGRRQVGQLGLAPLEDADRAEMRAVVGERVHVADLVSQREALRGRLLGLVEAAGADRQHHLHGPADEQQAAAAQRVGAQTQILAGGVAPGSPSRKRSAVRQQSPSNTRSPSPAAAAAAITSLARASRVQVCSGVIRTLWYSERASASACASPNGRTASTASRSGPSGPPR